MTTTWKLKAIGDAAGVVQIAGKEYRVNNYTDTICLPEGSLTNSIVIESKKGKLADSMDSFLYLYCDFDPCRQNIEITAHFEVLDSQEIPDWQSGYGILAADTVFNGEDSYLRNGLCCHRNHLLCGRFRTAYGNDHGYGLRVVGGYTSPEAAEYTPVRKLDPSRIFNTQDSEDIIKTGDKRYFKLSKTNTGFSASMKVGKTEEVIDFPGCDFLMRQDNKNISIGFAVGGKARLKIAGISVKYSEGVLSETPDDAIQFFFPDYPFARTVFRNDLSPLMGKGKVENAVLYVSPEGNPYGKGTEADPMELNVALTAAGSGSEIKLLDGIYKLKNPLYFSSGSGGTFEKRFRISALHPRKTIIDGSDLTHNTPLVVLRSKYCILEGLVFQNGPGSGLFICGSGNLIQNCEAVHNGDTGILICAYPGEERDKWPSYNRVENCDSYDNCDAVFCNADGFGAKIAIGKGNSFYRCIAHHNIDDGFDLYAKSMIGPTEPVLIEQCIAYKNGTTAGEKHVRKNHPGGIGFKLGGEFQTVIHEVWNCIAFMNAQGGFCSNTNSSVRIHFCTSFKNGKDRIRDNYSFCNKIQNPEWKMDGLIPPVLKPINGRVFSLPMIHYENIFLKAPDWIVRNEDGSIDSHGNNKKRFLRRAGAEIGDDKDKRILIITGSLGGGGAERVSTILASELAKKYAVYLIYMARKKQNYPISPRVHLIDGCGDNTFLKRVFNIPIKWPFKTYAIITSKWRIKPDATISMLHKPNLYNSLLHWNDRRVMSERNDPSRKPKIEFKHAKSSYQKAEHIVFQSDHVKNLFSEKIQAKSSIIRNPIEVSCFADRIVKDKIVTVGRYTPQKNHEMLIRAFALFHSSHPSYTLHLYGDGEMQNKLEILIEELKIEGAVLLEGFKTNIHEHLKDAKMFVLSSDYEGMSNALMEAMMMGLPCISTSCTGSDELIEDEKNGLLVPVGNIDALAEAMERLADDDKLRKKLIENAQLCSLEFEKELVVRAWERILFR